MKPTPHGHRPAALHERKVQPKKGKGSYRRADIPEPCTWGAHNEGCSCHVPVAGPTAIDPPEPVVDRHCPLHGSERDADYERDRQRDDKLTGDDR